MNLNTIGIKVQTTGVTQASRDLDKLGDSASKTEKKILDLIASVDKMVQKFSSSSSAVKAMTEALAVVNRSTQASDAAMKALTASMGKLATEVSVLAARMNQGVAAVNNNRAAVVRHTTSMSDAHAAARGLTGSLGALWLTYGNMAPLAAGAAIGASMKAIVSIGVEVEATLENIRIKGEASVEEMQAMREAISDLGQGVYGPQEIVKALETLTLAGLKAKESVTALGAAKNLALVGGTDINKAAESLVTIGTAVGATSKEFDYLADGISKTANISLASVESIAEAVKRASVVNKLYGASFEDILTQTAALAQLGIRNTAAGTAITNFYANALGGTEKAKKALDALGFSFQEATGKAKPLVDAFGEFSSKLNAFDLKSQQKIITEIFGERALRDVEGLRDMINQSAQSTERLSDGTLKYKNRLEEVQALIKDSAGTSALQAAQQAQTTENQIKAMLNTLKSTFGSVFVEIEPQIRQIVRALREAFGSNEFKTSLTNIANGFMSITTTLIENVKAIQYLTEAYLAFKVVTGTGQLFSSMIPAIQSWVGAVTGATAAATLMGPPTQAAAAGMTAMATAARLLPGIGLLIGALGAAWALYSLHSDKATESTAELAKKLAEAARVNNEDFVKSLEDEAERLEKVNGLIADGTTAMEAQMKSVRELGAEKNRAANQEVVTAAQKAVRDAEDAAAPKQFSFTFKESKEYQNLINTREALKRAERAVVEFEDRYLEASMRITGASAFEQQSMQVNQWAKDLSAATAAGTKTFAETDKGAEKVLNHTLELVKALDQMRAKYDAQTASARKASDSGVMEIERVQQARVEADKKNISSALYESVLKKAIATDEAKFALDKLEMSGTFDKKVRAATAGYKEQEEVILNGGKEILGQYEREAIGINQKVSAIGAEAEARREAGKQLDIYVMTLDRLKKLDSVTNNLKSRAEQYKDELDIMEKFGVAAKQTSVEYAKAEVAKRKFSLASKEAANALNAGADADMSGALLSMEKMYRDVQQEMLKDAANTETAKVNLYEDTKNKAIAFEQERFKAGLAIRVASGDLTQTAADAELAKMEEKLKNIKDLLKDKLKFDFEIAGLKDISNIFSDIAGMADQMGKGFERIGDAMAGFGNGFDKLEKAKEQGRIKDSRAEATRIGAYGEMTAAAGQFFSEGSRGYQAMAAAANVFRLAEMATNVVLGIGAILSQGKGDPYSAFSRMAAMAAVVTGLGVAVSGGVSGSGGMSAEDMQKQQGNGVFGDSKAKSESISKSIDLLKDNSDIMLPLTQGMLASLQGIEASMSGLGNLIAGSGINMKTGVAAQEYSYKGGDNIFTSVKGNTISGAAQGALLGALIGGPLGAVLGTALGGLIGNTLGKVWGGTKQSIVDSGIQFGGNVSSLQAGSGFNEYASVDTTKKSWFGLAKKTSNEVMTAALDKELTDQFALIFTNLEGSLVKAASSFGLSGTTVGDVIANTVLETTKLSLKDLEGDELTDAINAVISKSMDQISEAAIPGLDKFRQVGEGYTETVIRVATGIEQAQVTLDQFGITSIKFTEITNKQGDVAAEIFKQSVMATEGLSGVGSILKDVSGTVGELSGLYSELITIRQGLNTVGLNGNAFNLDTIKGAGGTSNLQSGIDSFRENFFTEAEQNKMAFAELTTEFTKLGKALPDSKAALKELIQTTTDQALLGKLLTLSEAFSDASDNAAKLAQQESENTAKVTKDRLSMLIQIAMLEKDDFALKVLTNQQREIEIETLDSTLQPLQRRIYALTDEAEALSKSNAIRDRSLSLQLQIAEGDKEYGQVAKIIQYQRFIELGLMEESLKPLQIRAWQLSDEAAAVEKANATNSTRLGMILQIAEYQKNETIVAEVLAEQRKAELAGMEASLRPLQERIYAIEDEKKAYDKALDAADKAFNRLKESIDKEKDLIDKGYDSQIETVKKNADLQTEMVKAAGDNQIEAIKKSVEAQLEAYNIQLEAAKEVQSAIQDVFNDISSAIKSTQIESYAMSKMRREAAQQLLSNAANSGGDVTKIAGLSGALADIQNPSTKFFKSFEDYAIDQATAANSLTDLQSGAQTQLDFAKLAVENLETAIETIKTSSDAQIEAIKAATESQVAWIKSSSEAEIEKLEAEREAALAKQDQILEVANAQLQAIQGVDVSVQSVATALSGFNSAFSSLQAQVSSQQSAATTAMASLQAQLVTAQQVGSSSPSATGIAGLYQSILGRAPDAEGLAYWQNAMSQHQLSLTDVAASFANSPEFASIPRFDVGTNHVPSDMLAMVHEGERIIPAADNAELMRRLDGDERSSKADAKDAILQEILVAIKSGDLALAQKFTEMLRIQKRWDGEGTPGTRPDAVVVTEAA